MNRMKLGTIGIISMIAWTLGSSAAWGQATLNQATSTQPASAPASAPQSQPANIDPQVNSILERLEKKGDQIRDIRCNVIYTKFEPDIDDKQVFTGILRFKEDKPNPRFFIRFDTVSQEGITRNQKQWHLFDGQWYIEAREKTKTITKRQVVRPGENLNVFRLGHGPFPLPFGQKKADIEKNFIVKLIPSAPGDPPNTVHLECIPRPKTEIEKTYGKIDFYIDKELDLPVRVRTTQKSDNVQITVDLPAKSIEINKNLSESDLMLPRELRDYQVDTILLSDEPPPAKRSMVP